MDEQRPDEPDLADSMACAVCAEPLIPIEDVSADGEGREVIAWTHVTEARLPGQDPAPDHLRPDHMAVPVPRSEVHTKLRCDFCSAQEPSWVVPVEPFQGTPEHQTTADWYACEVCARLVRKKRWDALLDRIKVEITAKYRIPLSHPGIKMLTDQHKALIGQMREYQTGPPRRLET